MEQRTDHNVATPSSRSTPVRRVSILLGVGAALGAVSLGLYAADGYSRPMLLLWLGALASLILAFELVTPRLARLRAIDIAIPIGLVIVFAPLYLVGSYSWPVQVNSDEIVYMSVSERWATTHDVDPFGLSGYFTLPLLPFWLLGNLGAWLGGVDLEHMRQLHGLIGLAAVAASYGFFRQLLPASWAGFAACVLGVNHALFMISRMALYQASALLIEVVALALLVQGLRRDAAAPTFLGGVVAGAGFYLYYPARMAIVIWVLFLIALLLRFSVPRGKLLRLGAVAAAGLTLLIGPVLIAEAHAPEGSVDYQPTSWLLFPEGRELAKEWAGGSSVWDGVAQNVRYGLSAFNNTVQDHSWLYPNEGHGFLDPLSGVLLWVGVGALIWRLVRGRSGTRAILPLIGFVAVWLALSFVVNKAPSYTRLLIALPFVAYFVTSAVRFFAVLVERRLRTRNVRWAKGGAAALAVTTLAAIALWNLTIANDFVEQGRSQGHDIGSTGRYVQSRRDEAGLRVYVATGERYPFYIWAPHWMIKDRLRLFAGQDQVVDVVDPTKLSRFAARPPFVIMMSRSLWEHAEGELATRFPTGSIRDLQPDGSRVVLEVPRARA
jgi:4-amino-4-deoxy-L-arabinose transferase-like glycosyltransferase